MQQQRSVPLTRASPEEDKSNRSHHGLPIMEMTARDGGDDDDDGGGDSEGDGDGRVASGTDVLGVFPMTPEKNMDLFASQGGNEGGGGHAILYRVPCYYSSRAKTVAGEGIIGRGARNNIFVPAGFLIPSWWSRSKDKGKA